ncbi:MAG TPA: mandelate racemase [Armatimonadetes bacterium]|nr:mandelate racemase [Armatimonadota bacterium]
MEGLRVVRVEIHPCKLPFTTPFLISRGAVGLPEEGAPHIYVKVVAEDGTEGWGEARPSHRWSYETEWSVVSAIRDHLARAIIGLDAFEIAEAHKAMDREVAPGVSRGQPIAKSALDMALHDLVCRKLGVDLRRLLGGRVDLEIPLAYMVSAEDATGAALAAGQAVERGYKCVKVKIGKGVRKDLEILRAIRGAVKDAFVWADPNQAYTAPEAVELARKGEGLIDVLEQPLPANDLGGLAEVTAKSPVPIAVDESAFSPRDLVNIIRQRSANAFVAKVGKAGGLLPARRAIELALEANLLVLGSGLTESALGFMASAKLYSALGIRIPVDLNGPQFLGEEPFEPVEVERGRAKIPEAEGVGPSPDPERLASLRTGEPIVIEG